MRQLKNLKKIHRLMILGAPTLLGLAALLYLYISKNETIRLFPCPFFELLGIECPGCGITRCISYIMRFKFMQAIEFNLAFFFYFWIIAVMYIFCIYKVIRYNKFIKIPVWFAWASAAYFIAFAVIRNFDFYPWHLHSPWG